MHHLRQLIIAHAHNSIIRMTLLALLGANVMGAEPGERVIAGFGSSVCDGYGDHLDKGGYVGRLSDLLAEGGWRVVDVSRGGDNTASILERWEPTDQPTARSVEQGQYLLPHKPGYVLIGLSLGNEGIKTVDPKHRETTYKQFADGMQGLIARCRAEGIQPVVVNCYARADFEQADYDVTQRMNLLINTWDVPSVNVLGAIDDGHGRWTPGFLHDPWHPSGGGYEQMFLTIVPSLFDAMEAGIPVPTPSESPGYAVIQGGDKPALRYEADHEMHAFSTAFRFRVGIDGTLATIHGRRARLETQAQRFGMSSRLVPTDQRFRATLSVSDGALVYSSPTGAQVRTFKRVDDGHWYHVAVCHRAAAGQTLIYLNGRHVSTLNEYLAPDRFELGEGATFDAQDWFIHRSALSAYDAAFLADGGMIQSSLEVYAPLRDRDFLAGQAIENKAQSYSKVLVCSPVMVHHAINESPAPTP